MSAESLIEKIEHLSPEEREKVYDHILKIARKREHVRKVLETIRGKGADLWGMDAQEYVNQLRKDDRF